MANNAGTAYLEAQVMSATPQKLRLMLIEGAIRFARQAVEHWEAGRFQDGSEMLIRCRSIISELLSSVRPDANQISQTTASIYLFLFKTLTEAQADRDTDRVRDAIEVLDIEHGTWQAICERLPHTIAATPDEQRSSQLTDRSAAKILEQNAPSPDQDTGNSLSLDA